MIEKPQTKTNVMHRIKDTAEWNGVIWASCAPCSSQKLVLEKTALSHTIFFSFTLVEGKANLHKIQIFKESTSTNIVILKCGMMNKLPNTVLTQITSYTQFKFSGLHRILSDICSKQLWDHDIATIKDPIARAGLTLNSNFYTQTVPL